MGTFNTYSKNKLGIPEISNHDDISDKLKNQVSFIWSNFFEQKSFPKDAVKEIREIIYKTIHFVHIILSVFFFCQIFEDFFCTYRLEYSIHIVLNEKKTPCNKEQW